jgi:hypothetical protein
MKWSTFMETEDLLPYPQQSPLTSILDHRNQVITFTHSLPCSSQLEHSASFRVSVITRIFSHTVGLLWTSDQPVAEACTYTGKHNIYTQETNIHAQSGIRTRDPSNQAAADLCLRMRGHWDRQPITSHRNYFRDTIILTSIYR